MSTHQTTWRSAVYAGIPPAPPRKRLRTPTLRRDHFRCQRCGVRPPSAKELTAHHIKPISQGGADELENTITLCGKCHDIVEGESIPTRDGVRIYERDEPPAELPTVPELKPQLDWRKVVYGGQSPTRL